MSGLEVYAPLGLPLFAFGVLHLVQLLVADVVGLRSGHTPGTPVDGGHDDALFRASRAHANTAESLGVLLLFVVAGVLLGGSPLWMSRALWALVALRTLYTLCYWFDQRALRSIVFVLMLLALIALGGAAFMPA
ncbi:MAG: MAPEG family protein [Acidobacteriota bacterium]